VAEEPNRIKFHYVKSTQFRVIHADGAYGGITPQLGLFLSFFNERLPIPRVLVHSVKPDGSLGEQISAECESKDGVIREEEIGVAMNVVVARALVQWLQDKIQEVERLQSMLDSTQNPKRESA